MADGEDNTFRDLYLKAAGIESRENVFFIGPYGTRVSFASQQRRGLNIVWALDHSAKISEGKRVAVVGAGIAGLTTAAALIARKCLVSLYEAKPDVLDLQSLAIHRFVHPTVNFWPDMELSPTTQMPFFDWYASKSSTIVEVLKREWKDHFRGKVSQFYPESSVKQVQYDRAKRKVIVAAEGRAPASAEYDVVVIATGFGEEEKVAGTSGESYWVRDYLHEKASGADSITISGTGDGGLIDVLRAIHENFESGRLSLRVLR